jgi:hypothetical protein
VVWNAMRARHAAGAAMLLVAAVATTGPAGAGGTPSDVVKAFYKACNHGEYSKAEKLVTRDSLERMASLGIAGSLSAYCDGLTEKGTLKRIETVGEKVRGEGTVVRLRFVYENGTVDEGREALIKRNGVWKIELLQTGDATTRPR